MATRTTSVAETNDTDAHFRAWCAEIDTSLTTFGWLATSDTGQMNFSTATRPTANNLYPYYAVYKMNDSLQSTAAVFMRIDFGTGNATNVPSIKLQFSIGGTNGSGTLTGTLSTQQTLQGDVANGTAVNVRTSGSSASFRMSFWNTNGQGEGFMFAVERCKDTGGSDTTAGICIAGFDVHQSATLLVFSQFIPYNNLAVLPGAASSIWYGLISSQSSQTLGGNTGLCPIRTEFGPFNNPMIGVLIFSRTDFTMETTQSVTIYGASHTYLMLRPYGGGTKSLNTHNADCGFAILWE
jgi:hypothetical protein